MHLITISAFLAVFWRSEQASPWLLVGPEDILWTVVIVVSQPMIFGVLAVWAGRRAQRLLTQASDSPQIGQAFHHRATLTLRCLALTGHGVTVFLTHWQTWFKFDHLPPVFQIVGDLMVLFPFILTLVALWIGAFPLERAMHVRTVPCGDANGAEDEWALGHYLDFNLRHHVLAVAVPMAVILFVANLTRGHEEALRTWSGWSLTPDALLGAAAVGVFVLAPVMLCRVWLTTPLPDGELRRQLEEICGRIGFRYREILVWHSDGMMINAAVMGVLAPVRYILLSDALLESMDDRQIEAVFGHEAGHIRRNHVQHFLIFAFVGWLLVTGIMELIARYTVANGTDVGTTTFTVEGIGLLATVLFWGIGFGWLSRRFEREADLFGAECVTPKSEDCRLPCSIHNGESGSDSPNGSVCATGAAVFASALDRVAVLNGIPHEERSWRHSSIGSRIRFLTSLAGDPLRAAEFRRLVRRIRVGLLATAVAGAALSAHYLTVVEQPAILGVPVGGNGTHERNGRATQD